MEGKIQCLIIKQKQIDGRHEADDVESEKKYDWSIDKVVNIEIQWIKAKFIKRNSKNEISSRL